MTIRQTVKLDSIDAYNKLYGLTTYHPLVTVIDLKNATNPVNHIRIDYGVYALFLKNGVSCTLKYGREKYDYQEGTIVSFSPGQTVEVDMDRDVTSPDVIGLMFHPDLIYGTLLGERIHDYGFFEYSQREALHLSEQERAMVVDCLNKIDAELRHPVDGHTKRLLCASIELLLDYCVRFYERQFITRSNVNSDVLRRFERLLDEYFRSEAPRREGVPTVRRFAEMICLSPNYFGDLVKRETGRTAQEHIQARLIDMAKERILDRDKSVAEIAYELGFKYPQHFSRLFKKITGCTPNAYRALN